MIQAFYSSIDYLSDYQFEKYIQVLPHVVQADILRYKFMKDRKLKLLGRLLLQHYHTLNALPFSFSEILYTKNGKPHLKSGVNFNISHSGKIVVVAFSDIEVGIDIEKCRGVGVDEAHVFFHEKEIEWIKSSEKPDDAFLSLWTRKEAYLKAIGTGIVNNLKEINCLDNLINDDKTWYLHDFEFLDVYHVAICSTNNSYRFLMNEINIEAFNICQ